LLAAVIQLFVKAETSLVHVARMRSGLTAMQDTREVAAPRGGFLLTARRVLGHLPFYRAFVAVESTMLIFVAAVIDELRGDLGATRVLLLALVAAGVVTAIGHLAAILTSQRLR
jgi:hypothetical protein